MAKHGKDAAIYVGAYDLTDYFNDAGIDMAAEAADTSTFGSAALEFGVAGPRDATFTASGLFDGSASAADARLSAAIASDTAVTLVYPWYGDTDGAVGYAMSGLVTEASAESPFDGVVATSFGFQSNVGGERVTILHALSAETADDTGTAHNNGAATAAGGSAYVVATAFSGFSGVVVTIEGSTTGAWAGEEATLATFTTIAGVTSERVTWTGTTQQYIRGKIDVTGTGSVTIHVSYYRG